MSSRSWMLLLFVTNFVVGVVAVTEYAVVINHNTFDVVPRAQAKDVAAWGTWDDTYDKTGWSVLAIHTNPAVDDRTAATAAGYFEGQMTALRIEQTANNMGVQTYNVSSTLKAYLAANANWVASMEKIAATLESGAPERKIWSHESLVRSQLEGMYQGYLVGRGNLSKTVLPTPLTFDQLLLLNLGGDLEDLGNYESQTATRRDDDVSPVLGGGRCSAVIRLTDDNKDIFVSQETWSSLNTMLRIWKMYDFPFLVDDGNSTVRVPGRRVAFSSYPGVVASLDDFYVLSSGLVVQETTIGNSNPDLYKQFLTPFSLYEFQRNIIANRLADTGASWGPIYLKWNSGSYNNMNMIVDYKLFTPGQAVLQPETLLIVEQIPGYVVTTDVTSMLSQNRYFASYNIAFDPMIRRLSGVDSDEAHDGPMFSYDNSPRAQIFRRDAPKVHTLSDLKQLLRSCDFKNDPLSSQIPTCNYLGWTNCTPAYTSENCIATRGDLNPVNGVYALSMCGHRNHIASDAKISHFQSYNSTTLPADVVCGPVGSRDNPQSTPTFRWSTSDFEKSVPHVGHPDAFEFDWVNIQFSP